MGAVACCIVELATVTKPSIARRLMSIGEYHRPVRLPYPTEDPEVEAVWAGIRHEHGTAADVAEPIGADLLRRMIAKLPPGARGKRDKALLLMGFAAALRSSSLVALDTADVIEKRQGLVVNIRGSKTDQEAVGRRVGLPYGSNPERCPVRAVEDWCQAARIDKCPHSSPDRQGRFTQNRLHPWAVPRIVRRAVKAICINPQPYSAHSLRQDWRRRRPRPECPSGQSWLRPAIAA